METHFSAPKGKILFQPGQNCPGFILLSSGTIKVTLTGASGKELVLYRVSPGEVCLQTLSCLISDQPYGAEGIAETALEGTMIPVGAFRERMAGDAAFRDRLMAAISTRFAEYQRLVEDIALTGFDARLARVLLRLVDPDGHVEASHADLAAETASGKAYVTRRLQVFARQGILAQTPHGLQILDPARLQRMADDVR